MEEKREIKHKPMNQTMKKCIELMVYTNMLKGDICNELGVAPNAISRWSKRQDFQDALREEMNRAFNELAIKAKKKLSHLIDSNNEQVALGACKEALNKAGYMETQKVEQNIDTVIKVEVIE